MTGSSQSSVLRLFRPVESVKLLSIISILALIAVALALAAYRYPPPSMQLTLLGGMALVSILALALARYDVAVGLGLVLVGVQAVEPAPSDAIFAIVIAVAAITGRFNIDRVPLSVLGSLGVLVALNIMSAIEAINAFQAAFFFSITLYLAVFGIWLADYVNSEGRARLVVLCYLAVAVSSAVLGVLALIVPLPGSEQFVYYDSRARGLFQDPNVMGPFMVPMILILLDEILNPRLLRMRTPIKAALLLLLAVAVLLSLSRAAWINLVVGVVVVLAVVLVKRGARMRPGVLLAIVGAAVVLGSGFVTLTGSEELFEQRSSGLQRYDQERFSGQEVGIQLAEQHPLGIGPGQYEDVVQIAAHSTFVRVLAEQGPLGLFALLVLVVSTLTIAGRNAVLGRHSFGIGSAALLGAWCGIIVNSFFVDTLHWRHLWIVAALIWVGAMRGSATSRATKLTP